MFRAPARTIAMRFVSVSIGCGSVISATCGTPVSRRMAWTISVPSSPRTWNEDGLITSPIGIESSMRDFALIQLNPGKLLVGWGPFEHRSEPGPGRPAFYVNDYFLDDPRPWKVPRSWEMLEPAEAINRFGPVASPAVEWEPIDDASFQSLFRSAHSALERGHFVKIVPVLFENGSLVTGADPAACLIGSLPSLPPELWIYGYRFGEEGMIGATPETLFSSRGTRVESMAVAGTRGLDRVDELLSDPKERQEHDLVVRDIEDQLRDLGILETGRTGVIRLPHLAHLMTTVMLEARESLSFETIVDRLHPTAALGSWPRNDRATEWLRAADAGIERGTFGAPFGVVLEDGTALCLVAIRNVAWNGPLLRIGAGAGVLARSSFADERKELRRKREQVKSLFGLLAPREVGR